MFKKIFGIVCDASNFVFMCVVMALYIIFVMIWQWISLCTKTIRYLFSRNKSADRRDYP